MATAEADIQKKIRKDKESSKESLGNSLESSDKILKVERENIKAEQIKLSSEEDLESLLKLAEDLKEKIDNVSNRIIKIKFSQIVFVISFLIYLFGFFYFTKETLNTEMENSRRDDIKILQQMIREASIKRDSLTSELRYSSSSDERGAINKRIDDVEESIKSTESDISKIINTPVERFSFTEFLSMPDKIFPGVIILFMALFVSAYFISKYKQINSPEKTSLSEVLQLLREVHGTIADREDWSILKRAEFRIRLSRFDLSEKKESVFNFFS